MAVSGNMSTSNTYIKYTIEIIQNSQNVSNNSSNVTVKVRFFRTNTGYETYGSGTVYCKINGTTYSASVTSSQKITNSGITLFTKTLDIGHGSDGKKTLACSAWISHNMVTSSEQSYSMTLTTIPRTSTFTLSASSVTIGSTQQVVTISRASSSFTHKVIYKIGSHSANIQEYNGTATTVSFTPSKNDCNYVTTSTSATATIVVETYNGSTMIGSSSKTFTANVPSDVIPTFSSLTQTVVDAGAATSYGYVQGKSKAKLDITGAAGVYGSTISSYYISGGGYTGTTSSYTTGTLNTFGSISFSAYVKDSRGRQSATKTVTITVQEYFSPKVNSLKIERTNASGVPQNDGTYVTITPNYTYATLGGKNTLAKKLQYKPPSDTTFLDLPSTPDSGASQTFSGFSAESSYEFLLTITDKFTSGKLATQIGSAFVTLDFKAGGRGIAFGKISEFDDLVEFDIPVKFNKGAEGATSGDVIKASKGSTTYWGMLGAEGENNVYIRTTIQGLLPYEPSGSSYLGTSGWPFNYIHCKDFICQRLIENTGTPTNNAAHIRLNTNDGNGQGDGKTHIGYITNGAYNHYFRGKGKMNINMGLGAFISGTCTVGDYVIIGDYDDSWNAVVTRRNVAGKSMQSKMGTSTASVKLSSTSTAVTKEATCLTLESTSDSSVARVNLSPECFDPWSDNVLYLGTSGRRWEAAYVTTGTVYSSSRSEKENIVQISDRGFRPLLEDGTADTIIDGIKNTSIYAYNYKTLKSATGDGNNGGYIGFLAEEVKQLNPIFYDMIASSYIREDTGEEQHDVREVSVIGALWLGLQSSLNKNDILSESIVDLENKVKNMDKSIKVLEKNIKDLEKIIKDISKQ